MLPPPIETTTGSPAAKPKLPDTQLSLELESNADVQRQRWLIIFLASLSIHTLLLILLALISRGNWIERRVIEVSAVADRQTSQDSISEFAAPEVPIDVSLDGAAIEPIANVALWQPSDPVQSLQLDMPRLPASQIAELTSAVPTSLSDQMIKDDEPDGVQFFGTHAYGSKFVYVLDVSGSMTKGSGARMLRARNELIRSIGQLKPEHSFHVVLYNNQAYPMFGEGRRAGLVPATEDNKKKVARWVTHFVPNGGTEPGPALKIAGDLNPDAVFFLSDGQFVYQAPVGLDPVLEGFLQSFGSARPNRFQARLPQLFPADAFATYSPEIVVHTIAFESETSRALMEQIALERGGQHRFIPANQPIRGSRRIR